MELDEAERLQRNEYQRRWRSDNPEKWNAIQRRHLSNNPDAAKTRQARWRSANPERSREINRRSYRPEVSKAAKQRRYDADPAKAKDTDVKKKWKRMGYPEPTRPRPEMCELCGRSGGAKALHLDHDHATGKFRGWLCVRCNMALGLLRDSPQLLRDLADYLERNS